MDDSFAFRTTTPVRRQVDRRLVKVGIKVGVFLSLVAWFAGWVIASERKSFADRPASAASAAPQAPAPAQEPLPDPDATLQDARDALRIAFAAARAASIEGRTFLDAGPSRLTELQPGYSYVVGPSTMPRIVSVASSHDVWAAAVMAPDGTCLWIRATLEGEVTRATGVECTGSAALRSVDRG
jgi:hypothetical protein